MVGRVPVQVEGVQVEEGVHGGGCKWVYAGGGRVSVLILGKFTVGANFDVSHRVQ